MDRINREIGVEIERQSAKLAVDCAEDESIHLIATNLFLYNQSGRYYLADTSEINAIIWATKLTYGGI
jgi:hypothetical protein